MISSEALKDLTKMYPRKAKFHEPAAAAAVDAVGGAPRRCHRARLHRADCRSSRSRLVAVP